MNIISRIGKAVTAPFRRKIQAPTVEGEPNYNDWEILQRPIKIEEITDYGLLPKATTEGVIKRDDFGNIDIAFSGEVKIPEPIKREAVLRKGEEYSGFSVSGLDSVGNRIRLSGIFDLGYSFRGNRQTIPVYADVIESEIPDDKSEKIGWETLWCINGTIPTYSLRNTIRAEGGFRKRPIDNEESERIFFAILREKKSLNTANDYLRIEGTRVKYIIYKIPRGLGPNWAENLAIEFPAGQKAFINHRIKDAVVNILGFLFGKRLIKIGATVFDDKGIPVKSVSYQPKGIAIRRECQHPPFLPIPIPKFIIIEKIEGFFAGITDEYLEKELTLNLTPALWEYWNSHIAPVSNAYASIIIAIEMVTKAWLRIQSRSKLKTYIPKGEWEEIGKAPFASIETALGPNPYKKRILRKLKNVNIIAESEKPEVIITEMGLPIGEVERSVFLVRNKVLHGGLTQPEEYRLLLRYLSAAQTVFNRILLWNLEYRGHYVDYSAIGFPTKSIETPLGGPENDGKIPKL